MKPQPDALICRHFPGRFDLFELVRRDRRRYPFLLESTASQANQVTPTARYDILFCHPQQTLIKTRGNFLEYNGQRCDDQRFLAALDSQWRNHSRSVDTTADLPFTGGWFLYLGYELVREIETGLELPLSDSLLPIAQATRIPAAVIYDHMLDQTSLVVEPAHAGIADTIERDLRTPGTLPASADPGECPGLEEDAPDIYLANTRKVLHYIREGDVFQVNLSRQWHGKLAQPDSHLPLYQRLRCSNPAPFAGFAALDSGTILSSSPERLVRVRGERVDTRPIAGTRPRLAGTHADVAMQDELIRHPKERAEHVMLIDLERNDLGRLCLPGSVQVDEMMVIESYAHVHHIVSNIRGELRPGTTPGQVIAATFPGGTITGCPKVRCMEIIAELEQTARGPYTGSFGYLNHNGDMDLNILIRTMSIEQQTLCFRTGAGLVADSDPERELAETRAKAKGLLMAIAGKQHNA
ncbi:MAG: aminodeoxychorismate synthase component I [Gammaproteobacteria bacterium]